MGDLADDMRKAAANEGGLLPKVWRDEIRRRADEIDASNERWARMAEQTGRKGQPVTFEYTDKAEEPA